MERHFPSERTGGRACAFGRGCKNPKCWDTHPEGRDMDMNPNGTLCKFGKKCMRKDCFFVHPDGRHIDDDALKALLPSFGMCTNGADCKRPGCVYEHPDGRELRKTDRRMCRSCGLTGHLARDCPKTGNAPIPLVEGQYVTLTGFPADWESFTPEELAAHVAGELEIYGCLTLPPTLAGGRHKLVAAFQETEAAQSAVDAWHDVFKIELSDPPPPPASTSTDQRPGVVLIKGFPERWAASDIGSLLNRMVKPSCLLGINIVPGPYDGAFARVRIRALSSAREVAEELMQRKVAGRFLEIGLEDENGNPQDIRSSDVGHKRKEHESKSDGVVMCQDFLANRCRRGNRCKFSHGEQDSGEKKRRLERLAEEDGIKRNRNEYNSPAGDRDWTWDERPLPPPPPPTLGTPSQSSYQPFVAPGVATGRAPPRPTMAPHIA
eukprot:TRINITY_DN58543_c0_g1_i1.p1 TRINITY_DN58543_c0_g1~~TRINITY_DN58543_c0_g1_i1.p1  ORF type:complete len:443 (+),score=58.43 TRINITY_DN58543_c0_g1_i1:26-1330(+)